MKTLNNRISRKIAEKLSEYRQWALENWVFYTFLKNVFFFFLYPLIYLISLISVYIGWFSVLLFLSILIFPLLDSKRISVVEKSPAKFVKAEKVERFFDILFWILYPLWVMLLVVFTIGERIGIADEIIPSFQTFSLVLVLAWTGLLLNVEISVIESSVTSSRFLELMKKKFGPKHKWHLFEFYPSEIIRARARFAVLSDFLSDNPNRKKIGRKFQLFYEGLKIYNHHLEKNFGFILSEPKRFYCQAKLTAYSKENVDSIKNGLESVIKLMSDEEKEPFEIIKSLKEMLNEPASFKDIRAEIDADPHRMRKWFSTHSQSIIGIVGIVFMVIAIILQHQGLL